MNPSTFAHYATIEQKIDGNELFGEGDAWATYGNEYCNVTPLGGSEQIVAQQLEAQFTHRITTHWRDAYNTQMRLRVNGRTFHPTSVINVGERNMYAEWLCTEAPADG